MKSVLITFGIGWGTGAATNQWGIITGICLGVTGLLCVLLWAAILDRYRIAASDVLGVEGRN